MLKKTADIVDSEIPVTENAIVNRHNHLSIEQKHWMDYLLSILIDFAINIAKSDRIEENGKAELANYLNRRKVDRYGIDL